MPRIIHTLRKMLVTLALVTLTLTAGAKTDTAADPDPAIVEFLLTSSAKDFKASNLQRPVSIQDARIGYYTENGITNTLLCGSFKNANGPYAEWTPFATIKTVDYEQWLGGVAKAYCELESVQWYSQDYSAMLTHRLND